jgi:recombinational DNA repair protein (RecF pathway)
MSYQKYLSEGVIVGMSEWGESGRILKVLTREGIRSLVATGVRELRSKMRSEIDVLTKVEFEYVEGKDVARLVGIFPKEKLFDLHNKHGVDNILQIRNAVSNVTNFVTRVVVGETQNDKLYESFLEGLQKVQERFVPEIEVVWLIKVLVSLGYWEEGLNDRFEEENFKYVALHRKELIEKINKSIESSQM